MKISLGGESFNYYASIGVFKALEELEINIEEIHCCGISCIPAALWFQVKENAYNILFNHYEKSKKLFGDVKITENSIVERLKLIYKTVRKSSEQRRLEELKNLLDELVPDFEVTDSSPLRIHAFNLEKEADEILYGTSKEVLLKALVYPLEYYPFENYISTAWITIVPPVESDVAIVLEDEKDAYPNSAMEYLMYATYARSIYLRESILRRSKMVIRVPLRKDFRSQALVFHRKVKSSFN